jgi:hypothetical protein
MASHTMAASTRKTAGWRLDHALTERVCAFISVKTTDTAKKRTLSTNFLAQRLNRVLLAGIRSVEPQARHQSLWMGFKRRPWNKIFHLATRVHPDLTGDGHLRTKASARPLKTGLRGAQVQPHLRRIVGL